MSDPLLSYCLDRTDFLGDSLSTVNAQNIVFILHISENSNQPPELRCYSWEDVRQIIEQPDTDPEDRSRHWRTEAQPSNYVHRFSDWWYDSSIDLLTQRYNTLVVRDSYYVEIGGNPWSPWRGSNLARIHIPEPVHRADLRAFLQGELTRDEFMSRLTPSFYPEPEDLVVPAFHRISNTQVFLGELQRGLPYGYGILWDRTQPPLQRRFDEDSFAMSE